MFCGYAKVLWKCKMQKHFHEMLEFFIAAKINCSKG